MQSTMMSVPLSLNHLLDRAAACFPDQQIVSRLPDKTLRRHSFAQWHRRTRALASALQRLGLRRGEAVATLCWNHHAHLEAYFGIPAAGGVMHTLNLRLTPGELATIAADAPDRFLIVDDILLPLARQVAERHRFERLIVFPFSGAPVPPDGDDYEALLAAADPDGFVPVPHAEDDPVSMCHTSGTTGGPKGVVYSHRSTVLHSLVGCLADHWGLKATDVLLPVAPMFHANAWGTPYGAVMTGTKLVFPGPHLHADDLLDLMQQEPPTLALGVPTIWLTMIQAYERALTEQPGRWRMPPGLRSLVGGAAVPESLIRAFARHGVWLQQGWGMTETSPLATVSFPRPEFADAGDDERFRRAAMAGMPVPLVDLRIVDDQGAEVPRDGRSVGEIQVRGPFVTGAYHGLGAPRDKFSADGWLRTGDVASVDGLAFVRITDRSKDLIKSGGEWISSVDLENALMGHPSLAEAAVIAIPDEKWSERPLACIVLRPGAAFDRAALDAHLLAAGFAKWQLPERYELIDAVPRTSTGKFWKLRLRERFPR
ncbi:MAG: long-chain fatty acid--CoA ligase [Rubrivivax sp.]